MRFMMLVKSVENAGRPPMALITAIGKLCEEQSKKGTMIETGGLMPSASSARVRLGGGKLMVTDGPFTETKEVIGGYAVFELKSMEEAIERARVFLQLHVDHWPGWEGETEIRPMFGPGECPGSSQAPAHCGESHEVSVPGLH